MKRPRYINSRPINVLSLFDGSSCGLVALKRARFNVGNYYASEVDKWAIQISRKNHPEIQHIGDVTGWRDWELPRIDLIIAGPPCQGFSIAGKGLDWDDPRSKLFFTANDIRKAYNPTYFLFENVASMKKEIRFQIDELMGVNSVMINSALVSAQNRKRLYWCNWEIPQPEDRGILLRDVVECGEVDQVKSHTIISSIGRTTEREYFERSQGQMVGVLKNHGEWKEKTDKANCLDANYFKGVDNHGQRTMIGSLQKINPRVGGVSISENGIRPHRGDIRKSGISELGRIYFEDAEKTDTLLTSHTPKVFVGARIVGRSIENPKSRKAGARTIQILEPNEDPDKTGYISTVQKDNVLTEDFIKYRKLTPVECERLQTLDDNYTEGVSNTQRYKALGNGWTVDVIKHILEYMPFL